MKTKILFLILLSVFLVGCFSTSIADVKKEENIGKTVVVKGVVENPIKLGKISGYTLSDDTGRISVSSENLPSEGSKISVKGVLIKDALLGYYIKASN